MKIGDCVEPEDIGEGQDFLQTLAQREKELRRQEGGGEEEEDDDEADPVEQQREEEDDGEGIEQFRSHHHFKAHDRAVCAFDIDGKGARMVTGGRDHLIKLWDLNNMDSRFQSFRTVDCVGEDEHGAYLFNHILWNSRGNHFVAAKVHSQPILYNKEGKEVYPFCKGDPYVSDQGATKGHTSEVTSLQWDPNNDQFVMTAARDSTIRLWDINSCHLKHSSLMKTSQGTARGKKDGVLAACYSNDGSRIFAATETGSVQFWDPKSTRMAKTKAMEVIAGGTPNNDFATSIVPGHDGHSLYIRTMRSLYLLDLRVAGGALTLQKQKAKGMVVKAIQNLDNDTGSDIVLSPNGSYLVAGLCVPPLKHQNGGQVNGSLVVFDTDLDEQQRVEISSPGVPGGVSPHRLRWSSAIDQIFVSTSTGQIQAFYHKKGPNMGVLRCLRKKRKEGAWDERMLSKARVGRGGEGEIVTPNALNEFRKKPQHILNRQMKAAMVPDRSGIPKTDPTLTCLGRSNEHHEVLKQYHGVTTNSIGDNPQIALQKAGMEKDLLDALTSDGPPAKRQKTN